MDEFLGSSFSFADELTNGAVLLLEGAGAARLSISVAASRLRMTRQGLTEQLKMEGRRWSMEGSPVALMHEIVILTFGQRWLSWSCSVGMQAWWGDRGAPPSLVLPATEDERCAVRIWHALRRLAEADRLDGEPGPADEVARIRALEVEQIRDRLGPGDECLPWGQGLALLAVTDGLQLAVSDPVAPMPLAAAKDVAEKTITAICVPREAAARGLTG
ncbi:hypothetical protein [Nocardioides montaniterrae]